MPPITIQIIKFMSSLHKKRTLSNLVNLAN